MGAYDADEEEAPSRGCCGCFAKGVSKMPGRQPQKLVNLAVFSTLTHAELHPVEEEANVQDISGI